MTKEPSERQTEERCNYLSCQHIHTNQAIDTTIASQQQVAFGPRAGPTQPNQRSTVIRARHLRN